MSKITSTLMRSTLIAGLVAAPLAATAQTASDPAAPQTMPETQAQPAADFTDAQLQTFVDAALSVEDVRSEYMTKIEAAETQDAKVQLTEEANAEMAATIEDSEGMDLATYNEIGQAAQANPELNQRIIAMAQATGADRAQSGG